jgi:hypothetical protein
MELEGSLPCSKSPATKPYPEPDESGSHLPTIFLFKSHSSINLPSTSRSSGLALPFRFSDQNVVYISYLPILLYAILKKFKYKCQEQET